jgi:hypothetical protein
MARLEEIRAQRRPELRGGGTKPPCEMMTSPRAQRRPGLRRGSREPRSEYCWKGKTVRFTDRHGHAGGQAVTQIPPPRLRRKYVTLRRGCMAREGWAPSGGRKGETKEQDLDAPPGAKHQLEQLPEQQARRTGLLSVSG